MATEEQLLVSEYDHSKGHPIGEFPMGAAESVAGATQQVSFSLPSSTSPASLQLHL